MSYTPFGPEWENEVGKNTKANIVAMFKDACKIIEEHESKIAHLESIKSAAVRHRDMFVALSEGIPWGKTFLSADNIREMNEAPMQLNSALERFEQRFKPPHA